MELPSQPNPQQPLFQGGDKIALMMNKFKPLMTPDVISKTGIVFAIDFGDRTYVFDLKNSGLFKIVKRLSDLL